MLLDIKIINRFNKNGSISKMYKTIYIYKCDNCNKIFESRFKSYNTYQFCNIKCLNESQRNGVIKIKKENYFLKKYGIKNPYNIKKILISRQNKDNKKFIKNYNSSMQEEELYKFLCYFFGKENINRNIRINKNRKYTIDFYIKNFNFYIQHDGSYWHGLNRDINEIKKFKNKRDVKIFQKYNTDIEVNKFCDDNDLKLLRVVDFNKDYNKLILDLFDAQEKYNNKIIKELKHDI